MRSPFNSSIMIEQWHFGWRFVGSAIDSQTKIDTTHACLYCIILISWNLYRLRVTIYCIKCGETIQMRLLLTRKNDAAINMAIDEAIFSSQKFNSRPTLRFYDWSSTTFSFGYFQRVVEEVNTSECDDLGIDLVRRITGGGTVIHGWDVTFSAIFPKTTLHVGLPRGISAGYQAISESVTRGLQEVGIEVNQHNQSLDSSLPNICITNPAKYDVMINGRKIAGIAQRRNSDGLLFQAYIALDIPSRDILAMVSKKHDFERTVWTKTTSINQHQSRRFLRTEIEETIQYGFEKTLGLSLAEGKLSPEEIEMAEQLASTKYSTETWNFRKQ